MTSSSLLQSIAYTDTYLLYGNPKYSSKINSNIQISKIIFATGILGLLGLTWIIHF